MKEVGIMCMGVKHGKRMASRAMSDGHSTLCPPGAPARHSTSTDANNAPYLPLPSLWALDSPSGGSGAPPSGSRVLYSVI